MIIVTFDNIIPGMSERYIKEIHPDGRSFINKPINPDLPKVLIVDDEKDLVELFVAGLRTRGFNATGLFINLRVDDNQAFKTITNTIRDKCQKRILVIDYGLGAIDARLILERLTDETRAIILSGASSSLKTYLEFRKNDLEVLVKPVSFKSLVDTIMNPAPSTK